MLTGDSMKVALRFVLASLLCCSIVSAAKADDRYRLGVPTVAPAKATLQMKPTYQTAADPRPTATATRTDLSPTTGLAPRTDLKPRVEPVPSNVPNVVMPTQVPLATTSLTPTPEMWFYEQQRQDYNNPELTVRRNAEQAAAQRRARLASSAWFGVSNSRPMAYTTPHMYHYSPTWAGNSRFPYLWGSSSGSTNIYVEARRNYAGVGTW